LKSGILIHPGLLEMLASMGHTADLLVCDAGYPVPPGIPTIDLAFRPGHAPFLDVLPVVVATIHIERAAIAVETDVGLATAIDQVIGLDADRIPHASLKERARSCRGVVRTGEYTRYANVILTAGVAF
jgi:D-ribose pyranase